MAFSLPPKEHPYESGKTDFLLRGACAELLVAIRSSSSSGDLASRLAEWKANYSDEQHPALKNLLLKVEEEAGATAPDLARLTDLAENFLV
jgi:hypothetical protein